MKRWCLRGSVVLVLVVLLMVAGLAGEAAMRRSSERYRLGEAVLFKVEDGTTGWWWGRCCQPPCSVSQVFGWRIADSTGQTIYAVVHDVPVAASIWQGSWTQIRSTGEAVPAGEYMLYVDTSVGTLSRSFRVYDPCCYGHWGWWRNCNWCGTTSTIVTNCFCRTTLILHREEPARCRPLFWRPRRPGCP